MKYFIDKHVYFIPIFLCVHNICTFISGLALEEVSRIGLRPLFFEKVSYGDFCSVDFLVRDTIIDSV